MGLAYSIFFVCFYKNYKKSNDFIKTIAKHQIIMNNKRKKTPVFQIQYCFCSSDKNVKQLDVTSRRATFLSIKNGDANVLLKLYKKDHKSFRLKCTMPFYWTLFLNYRFQTQTMHSNNIYAFLEKYQHVRLASWNCVIVIVCDNFDLYAQSLM